MTKSFYLLVILVVSTFLVSFKGCSDEDNQPKDMEIQQDDIDIKQEQINISKAELNIKYEANAVLNKMTREEFELTLYLRDVNKDEVPVISEKDVFAYIEFDNKQVFGDPSVTPFSGTGAKIATSLVLDYSGSMYEPVLDKQSGQYIKVVNLLEKAVNSYISNFRDGDVAEYVKFGSSVNKISEFSTDKNYLYSKIYEESYSRGGTALYSGIYQGLNDVSILNGTNYSRAVIAFTDGGDNVSDVNEQTVTDYAVKSYIPVFMVGLYSQEFNPGILNSIAKKTGGFYYQAPDPQHLTELYSKINTSLRNNYLIKIKWNGDELPPSGTNVNLKVRVKGDKYVISEYNNNINLP